MTPVSMSSVALGIIITTDVDGEGVVVACDFAVVVVIVVIVAAVIAVDAATDDEDNDEDGTLQEQELAPIGDPGLHVC